MAFAAKVVIYGTPHCSYCVAARLLLTKKGVSFEEIMVGGDQQMHHMLEERSGQTTVPQIFINDEPVGGFDELYLLEEDGHLDALLEHSEQ